MTIYSLNIVIHLTVILTGSVLSALLVYLLQYHGEQVPLWALFKE